MQLGLTIPLQKHLKIKKLPYGDHTDHLYCWDLHIIKLKGCESLLAVNCSNRFSFVVFNLPPEDWDNLQKIALEGVSKSFKEAGIKAVEIKNYLKATDDPEFTRTHGRREVAFLNRAWEDVLSLDFAINPDSQWQTALNSELNSLRRRCAGHRDLITPLDALRLDLDNRSEPNSQSEPDNQIEQNTR